MTEPVITMVDKKAGKGTYHAYYVEGEVRIPPIVVDMNSKPRKHKTLKSWDDVAQFLEDNPTYQLEHTYLPSISTIAKHADTGGPGLLTWAAKLAVKYNDETAHETVGGEAIAIGSELHNNINEFIATGEQPTDPSPLFGVWYSSLNERGVTWWASEKMVYHGRDRYAGTCDALGYIDGVATIFDWKTTDEFSYAEQPDGSIKKTKKYLQNNHTHAAQIAGYINAIREMGPEFPDMPQPHQAVIVYVFKDTKRTQWMKVDLKKATKVFNASHTIYSVEHTKDKLYEVGVV